MPKVDDTPRWVKPYRFFGLDPNWSEGAENAYADCPWCNREGKFGIYLVDGRWRCVVCEEGGAKGGGNLVEFMKRLWSQSLEETPDSFWETLAAERGLLDQDTLRQWGVALSYLDNLPLVPAYSAGTGDVNQVYRYVRLGTNGTTKRKLLAAPDTNHGIFGLNLYDPNKEYLYICEGVWDAMVLWEILRIAKLDGGGMLKETSNPIYSLLANANVLASPSANVFNEAWLPLFEDKKVVICGDSDHPRKHPRTGNMETPVGLKSAIKLTRMLAKAERPPKELRVLYWGPKGYDENQPHGYDLRDLLTSDENRFVGLSSFLQKIQPVPGEWLPGRSAEAVRRGLTTVELLPCSSYKNLVNQWRKAIKWTPGLDAGLACSLAVIVSTEASGDQLWIKLIGPPACGKSTICEALSTCKRYVYPKSTIRGFHSGYKTDRDGEEDHSLIAEAAGKTLVTKDGDTLLQTPNLLQVLSEARDIYDRTSRTHYRHGKSHVYENKSLTWILAGTHSLRGIDESDLGERFVDVVVMDDLDDDLADEILMRVGNRADRDARHFAEDDDEVHVNPDILKMNQMTGGYVEYLRKNAADLVKEVAETDEATMRAIANLSKMVALFRTRPAKRHKVDEVHKEAPFRLMSQFVRMGVCLAVVLSKDRVDDEILDRLRKIALDTARGHTLKAAGYLRSTGFVGSEVRGVAWAIGKSPDETKHLLSFMGKLGITEVYTASMAGSMQKKPTWRLTEKTTRLYDSVMGGEVDEEEGS